MGLKERWANAPVTAKRISIFSGTLAAVAGAITASAAAWPIIEFAFPAHRGMVYEKIQPLQATTNDLLIWRSEDLKNAAKKEKENWNIQLQKENDPQTRALIQQQMERLSGEETRHEERVKRLKGQ